MLSEVPEGWGDSKLEDVCEILDKFRVPLNSDERQVRKGNVPYWGANGIVDYIDEAIFDEPLLLMPEDGGPFGEARVKPICHKIDEPVWVNNHAHVLRVSSANREYVYQWFVNRDITDFLVGGTRAKLNQKALRALPILLPPLNEQHRIAEILSSVDASIQATQAVIEQAERLKRGLMEELLTGGLGSEAIERGEVPEGWRRTTLDKLCKVVTGKTPSTKKEEYWNGDVPFFSPADLSELATVSHAERTIAREALTAGAKLLPPNSILYTCIGSTIGKVAIATVECCTNQQINACVVNKEVDYKFLYFQLLMAESVVKSLSSATAVPIINKTAFSGIEIVLPAAEEQHRIAEKLASFDSVIEKEQAIIEQLRHAKSGLMDDLLTGKVRTVL